VFSSLTVEENLTLTFRQVFGRRGWRTALQRAFDQFPRLGERRRQVAGTLSGGEQRMLSLARVLVHEPKLLITDELSLGLAPVIIDEVYSTLATIRDAGTSLLIVEQHVHQALTLADDVVVVAKGLVTLSGPVSELGDVSERLLPAVHGELPPGNGGG
jgi:branched-chain amino acid transport system ATP-binding protein